MTSYGKICDAFLNKEADAGFFGSFSYILTRAKTGLEPIARPLWHDGSSTYNGYIFTRQDTGISTISDMQGKSMALVDRATTAGYIFQLYFLKNNNIDDMDDFFSHIYFAGSHDASAWAVYTGEAEVGGAKNHIYHALEREHPDFKKQMKIIARSPHVPSNGLAVRQDLNPELKKRLRNILLNLHKTQDGRQILDTFGAVKFIETNDSDYHSLYSMVEELGINLKRYPYK
jgi:phosphonate transport system substrate-binding protein